MTHFKGKQFKKDIIMVGVGYYLSYREVSEIMADRGVSVCHTTIYRWVQEYSQVIYYLWKKKDRSVGDTWRRDETYIKVKGKWHYLYRAIDSSSTSKGMGTIHALDKKSRRDGNLFGFSVIHEMNQLLKIPA